jgi:hypothetical protein
VAVQEGPTGLLKLAGIKNIVEGWCALHFCQDRPHLAPWEQAACIVAPLKVLNGRSTSWRLLYAM